MGLTCFPSLTCGLLVHSYGRFSSRSNPDKLYSYAEELLDKENVVLTVGRKLVESCAVGDVGLPPRKRFILHFDPTEAFEVGFDRLLSMCRSPK